MRFEVTRSLWKSVSCMESSFCSVFVAERCTYRVHGQYTIKNNKMLEGDKIPHSMSVYDVV